MNRFNKAIIIIGGFLVILAVIMSSWLIFGKNKLDIGFRPYFFLPINNDKADAGEAVKGEEKILSLLFFGDLMLDRHVKERIQGQNLDYLFEGFKKDNFDFNKYDFISANLEGAVTNNGDHYPPNNAYDFAFSPELIAKLKNYNFKVFNLANNHLSDQGERGITETRVNLEKMGFEFYGCPDGQASECSSAVVKAGDLKIGLAGFSMVYNLFSEEKAMAIITDLKNKTDLVIVNVHWGVEYSHIFNKTQTETARQLIDAGADVIIGHHPHVVQGMETYKNKPIFYSLGNFIFDQYFSRDTQEELAVELRLGADKQLGITLYPLISKQSQPSLMAGEQKKKYLEKIAGWSKVNRDLMEQIKRGEVVIDR